MGVPGDDGVAWWVDVAIDGHLHTIRISARSAGDAERRPAMALHEGDEIVYETIHQGRLRVKWARVASLQVGRVTRARVE
jgi:hypothetical protein